MALGMMVPTVPLDLACGLYSECSENIVCAIIEKLLLLVVVAHGASVCYVCQLAA